MARLRQNFQNGELSAGLTIGGTTLNSGELAAFQAVAGADIAVIVLDPHGVDGAPEIVHVTAHTALAVTATILRAQEGTVARAHNAGTDWEHNITEDDFTYSNLDGLPVITAGVAVEDEGVAQGQATTVDFVGAGVTATEVGGVATVTIPGSTAADAPPIALRPALWLPVDEGMIGVAAAGTALAIEDYSGHNRDGAVNGNPTYQAAVVNGYPVVRLDGTGDFFSCGNVLSYERNNGFSLFVVGDFSTTSAYLIGKESNSTGRGWGLVSQANVVTLRLVNTGTTNELRVDGSTNVTALGFFLATAIYDGSSTPGGISLRVNGAAETPTTVANTLSATIRDATVPLVIGAREGGTSAITGDFAEVLIFNRALNSTDRDALEDYLMTKYGL